MRTLLHFYLFQHFYFSFFVVLPHVLPIFSSSLSFKFSFFSTFSSALPSFFFSIFSFVFLFLLFPLILNPFLVFFFCLSLSSFSFFNSFFSILSFFFSFYHHSFNPLHIFYFLFSSLYSFFSSSLCTPFSLPVILFFQFLSHSFFFFLSLHSFILLTILPVKSPFLPFFLVFMKAVLKYDYFPLLDNREKTSSFQMQWSSKMGWKDPNYLQMVHLNWTLLLITNGIFLTFRPVRREIKTHPNYTKCNQQIERATLRMPLCIGAFLASASDYASCKWGGGAFANYYTDSLRSSF